MVTRNVVLSDAQDQLVRALVTSGRYQNASEALRAGLRLLELEEAQLDNIRQGLLEGLAQANRGDFADGSGEDAVAPGIRESTQTLMSRSLRLTRRAEDSLTEIARWTVETFGQHQAETYEAEILERCAALVEGRAHSRSCAVLVDHAVDLRFMRAGEHFLVFVEAPDVVTIVDILHSRSDLPRHIAALTALRTQNE